MWTVLIYSVPTTLLVLYAYVMGRKLGARLWPRTHAERAPVVVEPKALPSTWTALSAPDITDNETINVYVRRGISRIPIGNVSISDTTFDDKLLDLMAAAESKAGTMNSSLVKWDDEETATPKDLQILRDQLANSKNREEIWKKKFQAECVRSRY